MYATTPRRISRDIDNLCLELVENPEPRFLPATPATSGEAKDCFPTVERQVSEHGGSACYGWQIWEWPMVMVEAEFHAVWRDGSGRLRDVARKQFHVSRILFLPDPVRVYEGKQVNNVRRPLSSSKDVADFIAACDAEFELINRGTRASQHGQIQLENEEAKELIGDPATQGEGLCRYYHQPLSPWAQRALPLW